jgi:pyruvate,water dikinase
MNNIKFFSEISIADVPTVGGKNASLGEMYNQLSAKGIKVPNGFATTAAAFWYFIDSNHLRTPINTLMQGLDTVNYTNLAAVGQQARALLQQAVMPASLVADITEAYRQLCLDGTVETAVRSSATAEDLPDASFAGQHESYLNVKGAEEVVKAVHKCYASLFTNRAIKYRIDNGFDYSKIALSAGVQKMVRADKACSGVGFTLEPESGFRQVIHLAGVWGLGENIVQGAATPDEFLVFKPTYRLGKKAIIQKVLGEKEKTMVYADNGDDTVLNTVTAPEKRAQFVLSDEEVATLAGWALTIEEHYKKPMDIEWAKDGLTGQMYIIQARPETVHSRKNPLLVKEYTLAQQGVVLAQGEAIGGKIATGRARLLQSPQEGYKLNKGDIVVTDITSPDWDAVLKNTAAIITNKGGRTSHASIVARELGVPAVVGCGNATENIKDGDMVTVCCAEGKTGFAYAGVLAWQEKALDLGAVKMPETTMPMLIAADPEKAFGLSFYPNNGVGLMRLEFIITHAVQVHPMALVNFNQLQDEAARAQIEALTQHYPSKEQYFIDKLSQGVATIAAAFYPKDVIVRMSDFKTNEYANLLGGRQFEPMEENPMLGFRGASRYYNPRYKEGFRLECEAMKYVRDDMGLTNVKLMIPFCRTVEEGKKVVQVMRQYGLQQGVNGLEIYVMAEIPSNVLQAEDFAEVFDGFSIGSNDLTQLTLGIDRDSSIISSLFSEQNKSAKMMMQIVIEKARHLGKKNGLCGQAPSDFPEFAQFLVEEGINSISFNADALLKGIENINKAEMRLKGEV